MMPGPLASALSTAPNAGLPTGYRKRPPNGDEKLSAAGILFVTPDGDALFVRRKGADHAGEWSIPAGRIEQDEEPEHAARREAIEEIGSLGDWAIAPLDRALTDGVDFVTFGQQTSRFDPVLNDEHDEYVWASLEQPPEPLHPGLRHTLAKFFEEEAEEPEHESRAARELANEFAVDALKETHENVEYGKSTGPDRCAVCTHYVADGPHCQLVVDPIRPNGWCELFEGTRALGQDDDPIHRLQMGLPQLQGGTDSALRMALDRASVRSYDVDGHLHIEEANVCQARIDPYKGREIPGWDDETQTHELGLDPDKIYMMFRPPWVLEKAAPTVNGKPLLREHKPTNAEDHQTKEVAGSVGTTARWQAPFIKNGLTIWCAEDIEGIETKDKYQLSPGYHYDPIMEPGVWEGEAYDGWMDNIIFNHVAIVEEGRQGELVVIGDDADELLWDALGRALERAWV